MKADAEKAGLKVETVKASYEDYDFGNERWDLVAMILSWAPIEDPAFLARLKASIKPGGRVVFEHVTQREKDRSRRASTRRRPGPCGRCSRISTSWSTGSSTTTATGAGRRPPTSAWWPANAAELKQGTSPGSWPSFRLRKTPVLGKIALRFFRDSQEARG